MNFNRSNKVTSLPLLVIHIFKGFFSLGGGGGVPRGPGSWTSYFLCNHSSSKWSSLTVDNGNTRPSLVCEPHYLFNWSAPTVDNADGSAHSRVPRAVVVLLAPACARALVRCTLVFVCCRLLLINQALDFSFAGRLRNTCSSLVFAVNRASSLSANCGRIRCVLKLFPCVFLCQSFAPVSQFLAFCFLWFPQEECREPSCVLKSFPFSLAPAYEIYRLFSPPTFFVCKFETSCPSFALRAPLCCIRGV